ncbi:MAG: adenylyltransferase, partial [Thermus sp.]
MGWSKEELLRYHRQMILPGVGPEGQARLKASSVVV